VASLNLCADEYLLLLARPDEIVGVSYLARDPAESTLWSRARPYPGNRGAIEEVIEARPTLVLTMGGGGRSSALLATRLKLHSIDLKLPATLEDVESNLRIVARALGDERRAETYLAQMERLRRTAPSRGLVSAFVTGGGQSIPPDSLGARWMSLAGFTQTPLTGSRLTLEDLVTSPPKALIVSNYRAQDYSRGQAWLDHPLVRRSGARKVATDGRPWTCLGPAMIPEIERLRGLAR
jgi:iron complex transport system substrate-binding protein